MFRNTHPVRCSTLRFAERHGGGCGGERPLQWIFVEQLLNDRAEPNRTVKYNGGNRRDTRAHDRLLDQNWGVSREGWLACNRMVEHSSNAIQIGGCIEFGVIDKSFRGRIGQLL